MGPLNGMKVIDLTHVMAGPTCTLMLADMGADVIKVEKVPDGDDTRRSVPPKVGDEAAAFMMMNRNKRGIALDHRPPAIDAGVAHVANGPAEHLRHTPAHGRGVDAPDDVAVKELA